MSNIHASALVGVLFLFLSLMTIYLASISKSLEDAAPHCICPATTEDP